MTHITPTSGPPPITLTFPPDLHSFLIPYLPSLPSSKSTSSLPHVTLTYATSLDSSISLAPGTHTVLSGSQSKAMTHYLRSQHDAILVGVGTAVADDPALNCRLEGVGLERQPRPVVVDPKGRWGFGLGSRCMGLAREGKGKAPWVLYSLGLEEGKGAELEVIGGRVVQVADDNGGRMDWLNILKTIKELGCNSVMIEGGGRIINDLLKPENSDKVHSVIVTIAPTYLGQGGVVVSPERRADSLGKPMTAIRMMDIKWQPLGEDVVMCGRPTPG
ncbi:MAG: 2,5-diamino-6-(ribosylamino)-4(3H)-pyrimidinone 5'-phosphate reductase [Pycnora praestabilis]|nr:MAG: 2,5-diamino-6-(ribosylamino)-4(3H)-pyrimidinone 5'-phosphate reductase [Pycnora praestabilis]